MIQIILEITMDSIDADPFGHLIHIGHLVFKGII